MGTRNSRAAFRTTFALPPIRAMLKAHLLNIQFHTEQEPVGLLVGNPLSGMHFVNTTQTVLQGIALEGEVWGEREALLHCNSGAYVQVLREAMPGIDLPEITVEAPTTGTRYQPKPIPSKSFLAAARRAALRDNEPEVLFELDTTVIRLAIDAFEGRELESAPGGPVEEQLSVPIPAEGPVVEPVLES